jgi:glutamyl-tRNA synthetase
MTDSRPTGRLAPTPSGLLHPGNARSFLLAWLWTRSLGGRVILRVEDIDLPRCKPEFHDAMLHDLAWLGLDWDETVVQSGRFEVYREYLDQLAAAGLAYPCTCTRKDIEQASSAPHATDDGAVYPGTCRGRYHSAEHARTETGREPAWRFLWAGSPVRFHDELYRDVETDPAALGDFVLWRRDGLPGYQLAVTVDDALQGVTQVLRGRDLLQSTARQLALYAALGLTPPARWAHVPFVQDNTGRRMAKRDSDLSLTAMRESGYDPKRLIGMLAWSAGLQPEPAPSSARELVETFDLQAVGTQDFILKPEHLA